MLIKNLNLLKNINRLGAFFLVNDCSRNLKIEQSLYSAIRTKWPRGLGVFHD